jgi:carboxyl-terminal processing protease
MRCRTLATLAVFAVCPGGRAAAQHLSAADRTALVAELWSVARTTSATAWRARVDWDAALADGLRAAASPQPDLQFLRVLRRFVALLDDGQADVLPPSGLRSRLARPPLVLASVERRPFLVDYSENAELRVAHPARLSEILAVQGVPADDWIRDSILPEVGGATADGRWARAVNRMLEGEKGTAVRLLLQRPNGERQGISVTRTVSADERWPSEPPTMTVESLPGNLMVVHVHSLASTDVIDRLDHALAGASDLRGLILDLRDAGGGRPENAYGILARLTQHPMPEPRRRMALYRPAFGLLQHPESAATWYWLPPDTIKPRTDEASYTGPLVLLSAPATAGAAEDLLMVVRATDRGIIIGAQSAGSPGEPLTVQLAHGWSVDLSVFGDALPDGTLVTGTGLTPDIPVTESVDDLLAGRDAALARAQQYLAAGAQ